MQVPLDINYLRDTLRNLKTDLTQMIDRRNVRTPANLAECKRLVIQMDKHLEQVERG